MKPTPRTDGPAAADAEPAVLDANRTADAVIPATELELAKQQAAEHLAGWQRAKADYLNLKRQTEKDKEELAKFANAALVIELLPIYDNLKRALTHVPEGEREKDWVKGVGHIMQQFRQLFSSLGIEEIKTVGAPFNHELHHAVGKEKREGTVPGTVIDEAHTGFTMHGRLVKAAQVRVAE